MGNLKLKKKKSEILAVDCFKIEESLKKDDDEDDDEACF